MDKVIAPQSLPSATVYKPSELIGIFNNYLSKQNTNAQVVFLRGVYLQKTSQPNWSYCYDVLRDEDSQEELTIKLTHQQRKDLKNGNLVMVGGILGRSMSNKGFIQLVLNVSRIEIVQEQAIDESEIKRMELRRKKSQIGFKNVDSILEQLLYVDQRPRIALVFAASSITMSDFNAGINAAKSAIDFQEYRVNFSNSQELVSTLGQIDTASYSVIALIRGGGGGIEKLDELEVLEAVVNLKTPIIGAIGHVEEKLFIKQLVDKEAPTPNGLGQYFSEMVETVSEKKSKSRAAITEQIKKQFKDQLEAGKKQNEELQKKLAVLTKNQEEATKKHNEQVQALTKAQEEATKKHNEQVQALTKAQEEATKKHNEQTLALTKAQEEATKKHNEQIEKANKQNQELQKKLTDITKANETAQKQQNEAMGKLQGQLKAQTEASTKQSQEFAANLKKMQETNTELNKSITNLTAQNTQAAKDLNEAREQARELERKLSETGGKTLWIILTVIAVVALIISILTR